MRSRNTFVQSHSRSVDEEVSYNDFISNQKRYTPGHEKLLRFCNLSRDYASYCWIDTCCIDKSSSAELTEAINSMYIWYERAHLCIAYLKDVSNIDNFPETDWFNRGWTLQELIASKSVLFVDMHWRSIGSRESLCDLICQVSQIDRLILVGENKLADYSIAQRMSWAANRTTTRIEDQAYSLLGLFGVNMPLLYGEGRDAFRRLQEHILARGEDNSLFAWGEASSDFKEYFTDPELTPMFAPSPLAFQACGNITNGFSTRRILFEPSSRGLMVSIHFEYDQITLRTLLEANDRSQSPFKLTGLTLPLGCFRPHQPTLEFFFLSLVYLDGIWRRLGVVRQTDAHSVHTLIPSQKPTLHSLAYSNEYVRLYVDYNAPYLVMGSESARNVSYLHLRDSVPTELFPLKMRT